MNLNNLPKLTIRKKKRLGRGYGSNKGGHTVGRGAKGDKARGTTGLLFAGTKGKKSWLKRLPLWRGRGRHHGGVGSISLVLSKIQDQFKSGETVSIESLIKKGLISSRQRSQGVKLLAGGKKIDRKLVIAVPCSKSLNQQITKLGGKVDNEMGQKA